MMKMFEKTGEFKPDSLIVSPDFPILTEGIGLKAGYGVLKRGSLIMKGADKAGYIAGTTVKETVTVPATEEGKDPTTEEKAVEMKLFGILTDDTDTGTDKTADNIPATAYQSGEFNRAAVIVAGEDATIDTYEDGLKGINIYLRSVQNYE